MPGVEPFRTFMERAMHARVEDYQGAFVSAAQSMGLAPAAIAVEQLQPSLSLITEIIKDTYEIPYARNAVANSFLDGEMVIDCIKVDAQPALRNSGASLQPQAPAFIDVRRTRGALAQTPVPAQLGEEKKDRYGNQVHCPAGYVAVPRVTIERIIHAGGPLVFFQKSPDGGRHPTR